MTEPETTPRDSPWLGVAVACVVGVPATGYLAQHAQGWKVWLFLGLQLVATGLAFAIPEFRRVRARDREATTAERELEARADTRAALGDALDPVLRQLGSISAERDGPARERLIAQAIPFVLNAAANLIGSERSRACWFVLTDDATSRLVPDLSAGRTGSPTTTFEAGDEAGDAAIGMVLAGEDLLCRNIDTSPPPGWDSSKARDYQTFISVSVAAGDTAYGMLTLDSLDEGDLTNDDLHLLGLMGSALAAALAQRG